MWEEIWLNGPRESLRGFISKSAYNIVIHQHGSDVLFTRIFKQIVRGFTEVVLRCERVVEGGVAVPMSRVCALMKIFINEFINSFCKHEF